MHKETDKRLQNGRRQKGRKFFCFFLYFVSLFDSFQNENEREKKLKEGNVEWCITFVRFLAGRLKFFHSLFVFCVFAFVSVRAAY